MYVHAFSVRQNALTAVQRFMERRVIQLLYRRHYEVGGGGAAGARALAAELCRLLGEDAAADELAAQLPGALTMPDLCRWFAERHIMRVRRASLLVI